MKKLLFLALSLLFAVVSMAQSVGNVSTNFKFNIADNLTYLRYTGQAADTIGIADSTWTYTFGIEDRFDATKQAVRVELDEVSGKGWVAAYLQGKDFWQDSWSTLTTVNYYGGGSDTTFYLSNSTAKSYRFYQIYFDAVADTTQALKVTEFEFSLYK